MKNTRRHKLKPCPFCGEHGRLVRNEFAGRTSYFAACSSLKCFCCVGESWDLDACPDHQFETETDAAKAWNKRA